MKPRRSNLRPVSPSTLRILAEDGAAFAMLVLLGIVAVFGLAMAVPDDATGEESQSGLAAPDSRKAETATATAAESAATLHRGPLPVDSAKHVQ